MNAIKIIFKKLKSIFFYTEKWRIVKHQHVSYDSEGNAYVNGDVFFVFKNFSYGQMKLMFIFDDYNWIEMSDGMFGRPDYFKSMEEAENWIKIREANDLIFKSDKPKIVKVLP